MSAAYCLVLTAEDVLTIASVGARYAWSEALLDLGVGANELSEPEAWHIASAFDEDAEGGHSMFPLLAPRSNLFGKLQLFREGIV